MQRRVATVIYTAFLVSAGMHVYKSMADKWKMAVRRMCAGRMPMSQSFMDTLLHIRKLLDDILQTTPR